MRHTPWMHILNICAAFCSISFADLEKSAPSCPLMLPTNLLFLFLSRLDYCNSLHAGITDNKLNKPQRLQTLAARVVFRKSRHASTTALLRTLHWLPVKARIQYTIACLCFQCRSIYQSSVGHHIFRPSSTTLSL